MRAGMLDKLVGLGKAAGKQVVFEMPGDGEGYRSTSSWPYDELLGSSIFAPCPGGDFWETYRLWEAIEAGSINSLSIIFFRYRWRCLDEVARSYGASLKQAWGLEWKAADVATMA